MTIKATLLDPSVGEEVVLEEPLLVQPATIKRPVDSPKSADQSVERKTHYALEILNSKQITPEIIREVARRFREIFANSFEELVVCQDCEKTQSASTVYGVAPSEFIPLEVMDRLAKLPPCPCCQKPMELFHDAERTEQQLTEKFEKDAYLVLLREVGKDQILGVTFGYKASLSTIFKREWQNRFTYTAHPNPTATRDISNFERTVIPSLKKSLQDAGIEDAELGMDSDVFCWNCYFLDPQIQFLKLFPRLTMTLASSLPEEYGRLAVIGETIDGSNSHRFLEFAGGSTIRGVLGGDYVLVTASISAGRKNLSLLSSRR